MHIRQTQLPLEHHLCSHSFFPEGITLDYLAVVVSGRCLVLPTALDSRLIEEAQVVSFIHIFCSLPAIDCLTGVSK